MGTTLQAKLTIAVYKIILKVCHSTGSAGTCTKVGGEFYSCGQSEEINGASKFKGVKNTFHHKRETTTGMVEDPLSIHSFTVTCLSF